MTTSAYTVLVSKFPPHPRTLPAAAPTCPLIPTRAAVDSRRIPNGSEFWFDLLGYDSHGDIGWERRLGSLERSILRRRFGQSLASATTVRRFVDFWRWRWFWRTFRALKRLRRTGWTGKRWRDWVHRYNDHGLDGLQSLHGPGTAPALNEQQMAELKALVLKGPDPATDKVVRWRYLDLREEVARRFKVTVHESTIGKWLHQLGLTRLHSRAIS